ncbi:MAG: PulJ/GspJ family protein [Planctomycetota bacterium]
MRIRTNLRPGRSGTNGFTLVELVASMTVLAIIALIASNVIMESMRVYSRAIPAMGVSYKSDLALRTLLRDIRDLSDRNAISVFTSTAFTFEDSNGTEIAYVLTGTDLTRNGDLLADDVISFSFQYLESDGSVAGDAIDLHLVDIDFTVQSGNQSLRSRSLAFPRSLGVSL